MVAENSSVLVLSLETVSGVKEYADLSAFEQQLWCEKHSYTIDESHSPEQLYAQRGAVEAEFGRVICIGLGYLRIRGGEGETLRIQVLQEETEEALLQAFVDALPPSESPQLRYLLCAHNGREFDFPFLCRRLLACRIPLPLPLRIQNKKPWELQHLRDTFEMWRFGDKKQFASLRLLCHILNISVENVLMEVTGSQIHSLYYEKKDMRTISSYAAAQVRATAEVYLQLSGLQPLPHDTVSSTSAKSPHV